MVAAHLELRHTLLQTEMVGCMVTFPKKLEDINLADKTCGVDNLGTNKLQPVAEVHQDFPTFIHYCSSHKISPLPRPGSPIILPATDGTSNSSLHVTTSVFAKRMVPHGLLTSCHSDILMLPDPNIFALIAFLTSQSAKNGDRQSLRYYKTAQNEAFIVCSMMEAINFAAIEFRKASCRNIVGGTENVTGALRNIIKLVPGGWKLKGESDSINLRRGSSRQYFPVNYDEKSVIF